MPASLIDWLSNRFQALAFATVLLAPPDIPMSIGRSVQCVMGIAVVGTRSGSDSSDGWEEVAAAMDWER